MCVFFRLVFLPAGTVFVHVWEWRGGVSEVPWLAREKERVEVSSFVIVTGFLHFLLFAVRSIDRSSHFLFLHNPSFFLFSPSVFFPSLSSFFFPSPFFL